MRLIMARHGQTTLNLGKKFYGELDPDLTELGREQALDLAKKLEKNKFNPDKIYTSGVRRTMLTTQIITGANNYIAEVIHDLRFREKSFGRWEGLNADEIEAKYPDEWWAYIEDAINFQPQGAESYSHFKDRINAAFIDAIKSSLDERLETLLIIGHNGVLRDLSNRYLETDTDYWDIYFYQGNLHIYDIANIEQLGGGNLLREIV